MSSNDVMMRLQLQLTDKVSGALSKMHSATQLNTRALKANRDQLRALEKSQGLIQKLKKEQQAFKVANTTMRANQAQLIALKTSGSATAAQIKAQTALVKQSAAAFETQKNKLVGLRQVASNSGLKNIVNDEKRLAGEISKTTQLIGKQEAALRRMDALREQRNNGLKVAAGVGATGLGMRMLGTRGINASRNLIASGFDFDKEMADLQGKYNLAGNSPELAALRERIQSFERKDSAQLATAVQQLAQEGFTLQQSMAGIPALISAADASGMGLQDTAASFAGVMKGFNLSYDEFAGISDKIIGASNAGGIAVDKLNEALAGIAPTARASGFGLEETAAMLGMLNRAGISSSDAVSALEKVMERLQSPDQKALAALGIRHSGSMQELLSQVSSKTAGMSDLRQLETLNGIFGKQNAVVMQQLLAQMRGGGFDEMLGTINNSGGATVKLATQNTNHLKAATDELQASWGGLKQAFFDANKEWLMELARNITEVISGIRAWLKENPALAKTLGMVFIGASVLLTGLGSLLMAIAPLIVSFYMMKFLFGMLGVKSFTLVGVLSKLGGAFKALGAAIFTTPIGWLVIALAGLAFAIYKNWDAIVWFIEDTWDNIKTFFSSGIGNIAATILNWSPLNLFYQAFAAVLSWFGIDLPEDFGTAAVGVITSFGEGILEHGTMLLGWFGEIFDGVFDWFTDMPGKFMEMGGQIMSGLVDGIKGALGSVKDAVVNTANNVVGWFKGILRIESPSRVFMDAGLNISEGAALGITGGLSLVKDAALKLAQETGRGLPQFDGQNFTTSGGTVRMDSRAPLASSAAGPAIVVQGDSNTFILQGVTGDAEHIMRLVNEAMDRRERDKAARVRSAFYDRSF